MTLVGAGNTTPEEDRKVLSGYNQAKNTIKEKGEEIEKLTGKIKLWEDKLSKIKNELAKKQAAISRVENCAYKKKSESGCSFLEDLLDSVRMSFFATCLYGNLVSCFGI